jgi:hypothetical protein
MPKLWALCEINQKFVSKKLAGRSSFSKEARE